tara:strand:- start:1001 stop:1519 length:519 start_codon:yes stop_codon:yes gene_type:complete
MKKIFNNELDIDGKSIPKRAINKKQAPSIFIKPLSEWMSLRYWFDVNKEFDDITLSDKDYWIFFSNTGLRNHKIDEELEDLYMVRVYSMGSEVYVEDYYYIDSLKFDRWSMLKVMEKVRSLSPYNLEYSKIDFDDTYFLHDIGNFGELATGILNIVDGLGPYQPLGMYDLHY